MNPRHASTFDAVGRTGTLSKADHTRLDALAGELGLIKIGAPSSIQAVLADFRVLSELDSLVCMCPVERTSGWAVERFACDNFPNDTKFRQVSTAFLEHAPRRFGWFDAIRPEPAQRNVVLELDDLAPRAELESSPAYAEVLVPLRLEHTFQVRALICESSSLLAWFGAFHSERASPRQIDLLIAMIPAMRRRLSIERRLDLCEMVNAALETVLEQLGVPAYVISATGRVFETNQAGKALLETRRAEVSASLRAALTQAPAPLPFELTRFREHGGEDHWLAILRTKGTDARLAHALGLAASRLKLTPRQREVLDLVIRGAATTTIAAALAISERAVEQHISAMFDRAEVSSRAALVSLVLLGK